jgi:hypothetical protein
MYPPSRPTTIQFGISTAQSRVIGEIRGHGLLGVIYVVEGDLPLCLSAITFTSKGVILLQDDRILLGIAGKKVVLEGCATHGHRDTRRRHCGS